MKVEATLPELIQVFKKIQKHPDRYFIEDSGGYWELPEKAYEH